MSFYTGKSALIASVPLKQAIGIDIALCQSTCTQHQHTLYSPSATPGAATSSCTSRGGQWWWTCA